MRDPGVLEEAQPAHRGLSAPAGKEPLDTPCILLTQRIGDRFTGIGGLSLTVPIAAAPAAVVGIPKGAGHLTPGILAAAAGRAILLPVLPSALEMLALRRMTPTAFGTLMALEPALGVLLGLLILHQQPSATQVIGILLVVLGCSAAQRGGRCRPDRPSGPAIRADCAGTASTRYSTKELEACSLD